MAVQAPLAGDVSEAIGHTSPAVWEALRGRSIFLTGGTGFVGKWLLHLLTAANEAMQLKLRMTVLTRDAAAFSARHPHLAQAAGVTLHRGDITDFAFPAGRFDYILIDCPPSLGLLTINALTSVDEVFVPVEAHVLGLHGLDKLVQTVAIVKERLNSSLSITGIVACRVKAQTRHAQEVMNDIRGRFPEVFFQTTIRENVRLTECPSQGVPITIYAPTSHGAEDYRKLAQEVIAQEKKQGKSRAQA